MAILRFRVYWEEDESVYRDIAIKHTQSFLDFHKAIQKAYEFDGKQAALFYRSNDNWQQGRAIVLQRYEMKYKVEPLLMEEVVIGSEIKNTNQKFVYDYDFIKNWQFLVELINIDKTESDKNEYPIIIRSIGLGPMQLSVKGGIEKKLTEVEEKYDLSSTDMEEGYGNEGEEGELSNDSESDE